jgi:hypothetical protein
VGTSIRPPTCAVEVDRRGLRSAGYSVADHGVILNEQIPVVFRRAAAVIEVRDVVLVIYVGLENGAGWVTTLQGKPAVLLGLESIAECGWTDPQTLAGLVAHELGHVIHQQWRRE